MKKLNKVISVIISALVRGVLRWRRTATLLSRCDVSRNDIKKESRRLPTFFF